MQSESLKKILSLPIVSAAIIIIAIAAKIFIQFYYLNIDNDKSYQILAAQNFLNGNGFSLFEVFAEDISNSKYIPLIKWPPGYSLLLAPFLSICKNNVILATLLADALTCVFFILFARKLLLIVSIPEWLANLYILVAGFFLYSFSLASSTDFLALTVYIIAIYLSLKLAKARELKTSLLILISILLFFTGFIRYLYLPVVFVIPICLSLIGILNKNNSLLKKGIAIFIITGVLTSSFLITQSILTGEAVYIRSVEKGFYFDSICQIQPFVFSSLFNLEYFHSKLNAVAGISVENSTIIIISFHYLILFLLFLLFVKWIINRTFLKASSANLYIFFGASSTILIVGGLLFLSIRIAPYNLNEQNHWTYVHEGRYFAFPIFFLQQLLFIIYYQYRHSIKKWIWSLLFFCFLFISIDVLHNIIFTFKSVQKSTEKITSNIYGDGISNYIGQITKKVLFENQNKRVVVIAQPAFLGAQAGFYRNIPSLYIHNSFTETILKSNKEVIVLFITNNIKISHPLFESNPSRKLIGNYDNYLFYTINVKPE